MAVLKQEHEAYFDSVISEIMLGKSIDEFNKIISDAKKNCYGEIMKIHNDAYNRYLERLK